MAEKDLQPERDEQQWANMERRLESIDRQLHSIYLAVICFGAAILLLPIVGYEVLAIMAAILAVTFGFVKLVIPGPGDVHPPPHSKIDRESRT